MKKIILVIMLFFVIGCVKEKNCEDVVEGCIVVLPKKARMHALFFPTSTIDDVRNGSAYSLHVINKLPKNYVERDTIQVHVSYKHSPEIQTTYPPLTIEITCIERIND